MYMRTLSFKMPEESQQEMCLPVREKAKQDRLERYNMETFDISGHSSMHFWGVSRIYAFLCFLSVENIRFWLFQSLLTPSKVRFPRETWMRNQTLIKGPLWATTNSCWCRGFQNSLGMICTLLTSKSVDSPHTKSNYSIERMCLYPLVNQQKTMENHNL